MTVFLLFIFKYFLLQCAENSTKSYRTSCNPVFFTVWFFIDNSLQYQEAVLAELSESMCGEEVFN